MQAKTSHKAWPTYPCYCPPRILPCATDWTSGSSSAPFARVIVGEFADSALLKTFGASGMGVFPAAEWVHDDLLAHYAVSAWARAKVLASNFFAIGTEKKVQHPLVQRLLQPAL
jgi:hypothetical protein